MSPSLSLCLGNAAFAINNNKKTNKETPLNTQRAEISGRSDGAEQEMKGRRVQGRQVVPKRESYLLSTLSTPNTELSQGQPQADWWETPNTAIGTPL